MSQIRRQEKIYQFFSKHEKLFLLVTSKTVGQLRIEFLRLEADGQKFSEKYSQNCKENIHRMPPLLKRDYFLGVLLGISWYLWLLIISLGIVIVINDCICFVGFF